MAKAKVTRKKRVKKNIAKEYKIAEIIYSATKII